MNKRVWIGVGLVLLLASICFAAPKEVPWTVFSAASGLEFRWDGTHDIGTLWLRNPHPVAVSLKVSVVSRDGSGPDCVKHTVVALSPGETRQIVQCAKGHYHISLERAENPDFAYFFPQWRAVTTPGFPIEFQQNPGASFDDFVFRNSGSATTTFKYTVYMSKAEKPCVLNSGPVKLRPGQTSHGHLVCPSGYEGNGYIDHVDVAAYTETNKYLGGAKSAKGK